MTDERSEVSPTGDQVLAPPPPPPRRRAQPAKVPPPPRRARPAPQPVAGASNGAEPTLADVLNAVNAIGQRVSMLESGQMRYIESEPEPRADVRVADPESLSPFQRKLLEQTHDLPPDIAAGMRREVSYNFPNRVFLKRDGTFVELAGSPQARALYQDKGYRMLSEAETQHYLEVERPRILKEQRTKAHLIATIRNMFRREPSLAGFREDADYDGSLNLMSISQLEDEWEDLRARSVNPNQKLPPLPRFRSDVDAEAKSMMAGVSTTPPASVIREFEAEQEAAAQARRRGARDIEVTPKTARSFA